MIIVNLLSAIALLFSYAAAYLPPSKLGYICLFGLGFPIIYVVNLLFILLWAIKRSRWILVSSMLCALGLGQLFHFIQLNGTTNSDKKDGIHVLTYNVHLFGAYDKENGLAARDSILDLLRDGDFDVMCFQEFYQSGKKKVFETTDSIKSQCGMKYHHEHLITNPTTKQQFGVIIFSKHPIIQKGKVPFENDSQNFCIYSDIVFEGDTIRVINGHLQSIRFKPEDYKSVDGEVSDLEQIDDGTIRIASRLKRAFLKREKQTQRVAEVIKESPHPVILCGDFNDTPVSYTYSTFSNLLEDSFQEAGSGIGSTYTGIFPSFRIDYIMHSDSFVASEFETISKEFSDHRAVRARLRKK
ncbi:MAG: endonuclease/exonuclease/phosphatase family protein [Flavobacteriales bacterium]